jgi:hypothetical protein
MKYALVCPNEPVENGYRIAEVQLTEAWSPAEPTYWLMCEEDIVADHWYFNTNTNQITQVPVPVDSVIRGLQSL